MAQVEQISFTIDGRSGKAPKGTRLIIAAERMGIHIPRFCHHEALKPYGGCRMCLVEIEKIPKLQTACTTPVQEGMVVHTNTEKVKKARRAVLEFILINHPLDCPICDKGGECDLQNQYYEFSSSLSRFKENKIFRFHKSVNPTIEQDFNRCLLCKRCVRFSYEIASDDVIIYDKRAVHTTVSTFDNRPYNSVYSGNVIELCPVGALTDRTWRFNCRPWDLKHHPSICIQCPQHCHIDVQTRQGEIQRIFARPYEPVNEFWICDRGRFAHEWLISSERIREPLEKVDGKWQPVSWKRALELIVGKIKKAIESYGESSIAGIIENDHTLEELLAFKKFMRDCIGTIHYDAHPSMKGIRSEKNDYFLSTLPTYEQVASSEGVLNLGADLVSEAPLLALKIGKNAADKGLPVFNIVMSPGETSKLLGEIIIPLDEYGNVLAEIVRKASLDNRVIEGVRNRILVALKEFEPPENSLHRELVDRVASLIKNGKASLVLGRSLLKRDSSLLKMAKILIELMGIFSPYPMVLPILDGGNVMGAELLKVHPRLPAGADDENPELAGGLGADEIMRGAIADRIKLLMVFSHRFGMENPVDEWRGGMDKIEYVIRADYFHSQLNESADLLLPLQSVYERSGHIVNNEGRFDFLERGMKSKGMVLSSIQIISTIAVGLGCEIDFRPDSLMKEILSDDRFGDKLTPGGFIFIKPERSSLSRLDEIPIMPIPETNEEYPFVLITYQSFWHGDQCMVKSPIVYKRLPDFSLVMNDIDAGERGYQRGQFVNVESKYGAIKAAISIDNKIPEGYVLLPDGYIEHQLGSLFAGSGEYVAVKVSPVQ